jgi:hypothetical protein
MLPQPSLPKHITTPPGLITLLPGSDRKRTERCYLYRMTYRNPQTQAAGCVMTWEVQGGRQVYQIAVEREETGGLRVHCTCADAVYRAEQEGRICKHVRGFLNFGKQLRGPSPEEVQPARLGA